jgi:integrase
VKFPKVIRHRKAECKIYGKKPHYPFYRVAWYVSGQRRVKQFPTYSAAKSFADATVKDLAQGSQRTALTPAQAVDALAALERLQGFQQRTGRKVSLLRAVSEWVEAGIKLKERSVADAVDGFLSTVVTVKREDVSKAVEEFIKADEPRTKANEGQRAQLSSEYARIRGLRLRQFAKAFPGHAVCDLTKEHLDTFINSLAESGAKSRNHHRAGIKQFLQWAVRKDYLSGTHRLNEADTMRPEHANNGATEFYTSKEFRDLLETADARMLPIIAIGGLAGLRTAELLRLDWEDVWRVNGHIEVTAGKAKTRQRRLVEVCPALAAWLQEFRAIKKGKLWSISEIQFQKCFRNLCKDAEVTRKSNGLRHSFCSFHFAVNANENLTATQAGNAPSMIHQHYKGLATKAEAEKWFAVKPAETAGNVIPFSAKNPR